MSRSLWIGLALGGAWLLAAAAAPAEPFAAECATERFLPLGDGRAVSSEAVLTDENGGPPTYFAITADGSLHRSLALSPEPSSDDPESPGRLSWRRASTDERFEAVTVCTAPPEGAALLVVRDADDELWARRVDADEVAPWTPLGSAPHDARLGCADGRLRLNDASGRAWVREWTPEGRLGALGERAPLRSCETAPLRLPSGARLWDGLRSRLASCPWGPSLREGSVSVAGTFRGAELAVYSASADGDVPLELLACLEGRLRGAFETHAERGAVEGSAVEGSAVEDGAVEGSGVFSGMLAPPLRMSPRVLDLRLLEGGRTTFTLALHQDYGTELAVEEASSDLGFLAASATGEGKYARLYVSAPSGGGEFDGQLLLRTNVPAQPRVAIPIRGRFAD